MDGETSTPRRRVTIVTTATSPKETVVGHGHLPISDACVSCHASSVRRRKPMIESRYSHQSQAFTRMTSANVTPWCSNRNPYDNIPFFDALETTIFEISIGEITIVAATART